MHDCLVIGAGPAGLQAGIFLGRAGVKTLLIGKPKDSHLTYGQVVENLFGVDTGPSGPALLEAAVRQIEKAGVTFREDEVTDVREKEPGVFRVELSDRSEEITKTVIIASGASIPKAGIEGEEAWLGKGLHTCVACDGPLYRGKTIAVVGSGNHAAQEALEVSAYATPIILTQGKKPSWSETYDAALKEKTIRIDERRGKRIVGDKRISGILCADETTLEVTGVFIASGTTGASAFADKIGLLKDGNFIKIDRSGKTNVDGIYAAGECTGGNAQIAKSAGEGCNAAISVIRLIKGVDRYVDQT